MPNKRPKKEKRICDLDPLDPLKRGAALVLSISGGKDSQAMSYYLWRLYHENDCTGPIHFVHSNLGKAEWSWTPSVVRNFANEMHLPLSVVHYHAGDLIDRIWLRYDADPTGPVWPSSEARYCTSDTKRGPISVWIRNTFPTGEVVCAMGLRDDESPARKRRPKIEYREDCCSQKRTVINWSPIHDWTEEDVWHEIHVRIGNGDTLAGWRATWAFYAQQGLTAEEFVKWFKFRTAGNYPFHPAYAFGNSRLSCACCVLADENDIINGAVHNPETYKELCLIEAVTGKSFKSDMWLSDVRPELLDEDTLAAVAIHKERRIEVERARENI